MRTLLGLAIACVGVGCFPGVQVERVRAQRWLHPARFAIHPESETRLAQAGLDRHWQNNLSLTIKVLEKQHDAEPDRDLALTLADLYRVWAAEIQSTSPDIAIRRWLTACQYAQQGLVNPRFSDRLHADSPAYGKAVELYNQSLESGLRLAAYGTPLPKELVVRGRSIKVDCQTPALLAGDLSRLRFSQDYAVTGLSQVRRQEGLGVPTFALYDQTVTADPAYRYLAPGTTLPLTANLDFDANTADRMVVRLDNPLDRPTIRLASYTQAPVAADLSTPLAYLVDFSNIGKFASTGLFRPDNFHLPTGLYMLEPYQPGKIPVVLTHGLWSSPQAWTELYNELRSQPEIYQHFQFWVFAYPTANPIPFTASRLRQSLYDVRQTIDPHGKDRALNHWVLVGHSMGGVLSKMMVQSSADQLWQAVGRKPIDDVKLRPDERDRLRDIFYFEPTPFVDRVVFIATPHRGSPYGANVVGKVSSYFVRLPKQILDIESSLQRVMNLKDYRLPTSIDMLSDHDPVLATIADLPIHPTVKLHSIIGNADGGPAGTSTDGIVAYRSSHLDKVLSEKLVHAGHSCQDHPEAIAEVQRILLLHWSELQAKLDRPIRSAELFTPADAN